MSNVPTRCIDSILKCCGNCLWGYRSYPAWVETFEDTYCCQFEEGCCLGYDQGRPEDEPTPEELKQFDEWLKKTYNA